MHEANEIIDGFYKIRQDMRTKRIELFKLGEKIRDIQPGRLLTLDELFDMLIRERASINFFGGGDDEQ